MHPRARSMDKLMSSYTPSMCCKTTILLGKLYKNDFRDDDSPHMRGRQGGTRTCPNGQDKNTSTRTIVGLVSRTQHRCRKTRKAVAQDGGFLHPAQANGVDKEKQIRLQSP